MAFHMTLGRGIGSMIGLIGFYQLFKDIQQALRNSSTLIKEKFGREGAAKL
jgi:hypothetical protein